MVIFYSERSYNMFTNIKMTIDENLGFVGVSCYKDGLPHGIPNDLNNMDYQDILDEIIANGTKNFAKDETIPTELQKNIDDKKSS